MLQLTKYAFIFVLGMLFVSAKTLAQRDSSQVKPDYWAHRRAKAVYVEALGTSIGLSLHYDMRFKKGHRGPGMNIGLNAPIEDGQMKTYSYSFIFNHVSSNQRATLEAGAGLTFGLSRKTYEDVNHQVHHDNHIEYGGVGNLGIRFQPKRVGPVLRLFWSPMVDFMTGSPANLLWFGISLGVGFN